MSQRKGYVISVRIPEELGKKFDATIEKIQNKINKKIELDDDIPYEVVVGKTQLITKWIDSWVKEQEQKT